MSVSNICCIGAGYVGGPTSNALLVCGQFITITFLSNE